MLSLFSLQSETDVDRPLIPSPCAFEKGLDFKPSLSCYQSLANACSFLVNEMNSRSPHSQGVAFLFPPKESQNPPALVLCCESCPPDAETKSLPP